MTNPNAQHLTRREQLTQGLCLDRMGLEVSPLFRPTVLKQEHNVFYTDYTSAEESRKKHQDYEHDQIMDIDFVWVPGKQLIDCIPDNRRFHWAIASHVLEHVPDPIGWLAQIFAVLEEGGTLSLALPDKRFCFDVFRRDTDAADLVDAWIRRETIPGPRQLFDFLSRSVNDNYKQVGREVECQGNFENASRSYTDAQALEFVVHSWTTGNYLDAHCSVFSPESIVSLFSYLNNLGILNIDVSAPVLGQGEFFCKMTKIGEPRIFHPEISFPKEPDDSYVIQQSLLADLAHARKAFEDAVFVQKELQAKLHRVKRLFAWLPDVIKRQLKAYF
jgi:hypothetical protein